MQAFSYEKAKGTKGDLLMTTALETWNACLLNAMALPGLPRLGVCPTDLRLRANLATIPQYDETVYYKNATAGGSSGGSSGASSSSGSSSSSSSSSSSEPYSNSTEHLSEYLTRTEVLHFARRVGYSAVSLNFTDYVYPKDNGTASGTVVPKITMQQAISKVLTGDAAKNSNTQIDPPKVYNDYILRKHNGLALWDKERKEKRNNWMDVLQLPYPRFDPIQRRLKRWDLEQYFEMGTLTVDPSNDYIGSITLKSGNEIAVLNKLQTEATVFYRGRPISKTTGKIDNSNRNRLLIVIREMVRKLTYIQMSNCIFGTMYLCILGTS
jgi:hypothetical protein